MKPRPDHLEVLTLKHGHFTDLNRVRYRVYQSATEYIAVIAESALMAIRISGVKEPTKVVRDVPTLHASVEKGVVHIEESAERVPMPTMKPDIKPFFNEVVPKVAEDFISVTLADLHLKKTPNESVISRRDGMKGLQDVPETAPTLTKAPLAPVVESLPPIQEAGPPADTGDKPLSSEEIAKLLGDS